MARTVKDVAEYFPHFVSDSRTKSILESRYGNDGYAFWFKLLELLCKSDGHYYDCQDPLNQEYLFGYTKVSMETAEQILELLASLGKIDRDLWEKKRVIWCQALVNNLKPVYEKRKRELPQKPQFSVPEKEHSTDSCTENESKPEFSGQPVPKMQQSRVEKSRVKESKEKIPPVVPQGTSEREEIQSNQSDLEQQSESLTVETARGSGEEKPVDHSTTSVQQERFKEFWRHYPRKVGKGAAEKAWDKIKPGKALLSLILSALDQQKACEQWQRENGRYIPNPATWLNQKRWEDDIGMNDTPDPDGSSAESGAPPGDPPELPPDIARAKQQHEEAMKRFMAGECGWEELVPE